MTTPVPTRPGQRPDASMDLLRRIRESALDPAYLAPGPSGRRFRATIVVPALLAIGLLLGLAFGATTRAAPAGAEERAQLIARIRQLETDQDRLRAQANQVARENTDLERQRSGLDPASDALARALGASAGSVAVTGPGVRITVDDGPDTEQNASRVLDADLRVLVNGLWASGAEAVAVNGHRLSSRTAIREAGDAVTVDYRSLTRPYVVEAIGDPEGLDVGFAATSGGAWWRTLQKEYQMQFGVERVAALALDADPGLGVEHARPVR